MLRCIQMSATIYYRKQSKTDPHLKGVSAPQHFMLSLERAFGRFPCVLGPDEISTLRGMAALQDEGETNPYQELIAIIERDGAVELYSDY